MYKTHGYSQHRLNVIWRHMKQRCNNSNDDAFKNYGEKGIKVCQEWENDFMAFFNWSYQNGYEDNLTIERVDSNKGYEPSNCEWITRAENCRRAQVGRKQAITFKGKTMYVDEWAKELNIAENTLRGRLSNAKWTLEESLTKGFYGKSAQEEKITFKGETKYLSEWAAEIGLSASGLYQRLHSYGWSVEKALTTINKKGRTTSNKVTFNGNTLTLAEWSEKTGIPQMTIYHRLYKYGWSEEEALTKPVRAKRKK